MLFRSSPGCDVEGSRGHPGDEGRGQVPRGRAIPELTEVVAAPAHEGAVDGAGAGVLEPDRHLGQIAEDAGCGFIETANAPQGLREALAQVRRDHVLLLSASYAVERGFADELDELFAYDAGDAPRTLRAAPNSFATRLLPRLSKPAGIIAPRRVLTQINSSFDMDRLARKLKGANLATRARSLS